MVYALRESLRLVLEEGLEPASRATAATRPRSWPASARSAARRSRGGPRLPSLNCVRAPEGVDEGAGPQGLLADTRSRSAEASVRSPARSAVGLMGESSRQENVLAVLAALEQALAKPGKGPKPGAPSLQAAMEGARRPGRRHDRRGTVRGRWLQAACGTRRASARRTPGALSTPHGLRTATAAPAAGGFLLGAVPAREADGGERAEPLRPGEARSARISSEPVMPGRGVTTQKSGGERRTAPRARPRPTRPRAPRMRRARRSCVSSVRSGALSSTTRMRLGTLATGVGRAQNASRLHPAARTLGGHVRPLRG